MNIKKIFYALLVCCVSLSPHFAIAGESSIYFCTKDLESLPSYSVKKTLNGNEDNLTVHSKIDNKYNAYLRHCFMMIATKIGEADGKLYLKNIRTMDYGINPKTNRGEAIFNDSGESLVGVTVSCVPVLEESDMGAVISGDKEKANAGVFIKDEWYKIMRTMDDDAVKSEYSTSGHNCCTVAYNAVKYINGHLERIDEKSFNFHGMGIVWGRILSEEPIKSIVSSASYITSVYGLSRSLYSSVIEADERQFD